MTPRTRAVAICVIGVAGLTACGTPEDRTGPTSSPSLSYGASYDGPLVAGPPVPADSACAQGNHESQVIQVLPEADRTRYVIAVSARPGTEPCELRGASRRMDFLVGGRTRATTTSISDVPGERVTLAPERFVAFDVVVSTAIDTDTANAARFELPSTQGAVGPTIATGAIRVDPRAEIGPVRAVQLFEATR